MALKRWVEVACLGVLMAAVMGCTEEPASGTEQEIEYFKKSLSNGQSMADACIELDALCKASGFGCKAFNLFCTTPTKKVICQQLAAACTTYPVACDVYIDHCANTPQLDAGPSPAPDGWEVPPPYLPDAGWWQLDAWAQPYPDVNPYFLDASCPSSPDLW